MSRVRITSESTLVKGVSQKSTPKLYESLVACAMAAGRCVALYLHLAWNLKLQAPPRAHGDTTEWQNVPGTRSVHSITCFVCMTQPTSLLAKN